MMIANARTAMENQATLILASTVPASYARSVQSNLTLSRPDISFIDAPVSGGALRAANGTLSIMAGASDSALERGKFLLSELADANKLYLVPGGVGAGSNMKMVHQVLAAVQILAASEAMGLAARLGLDATRVKDEVITSDAWSWMFENRVGRMLSEDYVPGVSALTIILKDVVCLLVSVYFSRWDVDYLGDHNILDPRPRLPDPPLLDRRANLPHGPAPRVRASRRRGHGKTVLSGPNTKSHQQRFRRRSRDRDKEDQPRPRAPPRNPPLRRGRGAQPCEVFECRSGYVLPPCLRRGGRERDVQGLCAGDGGHQVRYQWP